VGPGNAHFISIRQVSSDAATLRAARAARRCSCCSSAAASAPHESGCHSAAAAI